MKWKKEFVDFVKKHNADLALATWQGSPFEDETPKHPIELVNDKYPDGWCVQDCKEVIEDLNSFYSENFVFSNGFFGSNFYQKKLYRASSTMKFGTLITKTEYLQLTNREPKQRDWTWVKVKVFCGSNKVYEIGYSDIYKKYKLINGYYTQEEIEHKIKKGVIIELKDEPTTEKVEGHPIMAKQMLQDEPTSIHVLLPNVPHYGGNDNPLPPIRIIQHYNLSFELGNVIKYVLRDKGSKIEDLKKAIDYLNFEIGKHENK